MPGNKSGRRFDDRNIPNLIISVWLSTFTCVWGRKKTGRNCSADDYAKESYYKTIYYYCI